MTMIDPTAISSAAQMLGKSMQGNDANDKSIGGINFMDMVKESIGSVRSAQLEGETLSAKALIGEADITQVVQSVAKAESMLQTMVAVRDRLLSAFQEIMATRI